MENSTPPNNVQEKDSNGMANWNGVGFQGGAGTSGNDPVPGPPTSTGAASSSAAQDLVSWERRTLEMRRNLQEATATICVNAATYAAVRKTIERIKGFVQLYDTNYPHWKSLPFAQNILGPLGNLGRLELELDVIMDSLLSMECAVHLTLAKILEIRKQQRDEARRRGIPVTAVEEQLDSQVMSLSAIIEKVWYTVQIMNAVQFSN